MIVQTIQRNVAESSDFKSEIATIDPEEMKYISSLLRNNYSDPILATVRETVANALDANAGAARPIEITAPTFQDPVFKVRDFGAGLSEEDLFGLYTKYGRSTKRSDNTCVGGFGIGRFAPLSYTDTFNVVSRNNGKEVIISVYLDEEGNTRFTKLGEQEVSGDSGLEIIVAAKVSDFAQFRKSIEICTCFLEKDYVLSGLPKVKTEWAVKNDTWGLFDSSNGEFHPCARQSSSGPQLVMGGFAYPINLETLMGSDAKGSWPAFLSVMNSMYNPHKFVFFAPVGSVSLHHSRESLEYNPRTKAFLKNYFKNVERELLVDFQTQLNKFSDSFEFINAHGKICDNLVFKHTANRKFVFNSASGETFQLNSLERFNDKIIAVLTDNIRKRRKSSNSFRRVNLKKESFYLADLTSDKTTILVADERGWQNSVNWLYKNKQESCGFIVVVSKKVAEEDLLINHTKSKNVLFVSKTEKISIPKASASNSIKIWREGDCTYGNDVHRAVLPDTDFHYVIVKNSDGSMKHVKNHEAILGNSRVSLNRHYAYYGIVQVANNFGIEVKALYGVYNELNLPPNAKNLFTELSEKFNALVAKNKDILVKKASAMHYRTLLDQSFSNASNTLFRIDLHNLLGADHPLTKMKSLGFDAVKYKDDAEEEEVAMISKAVSSDIFTQDQLPVDHAAILAEVMAVAKKYPMFKHIGWNSGDGVASDMINYIKFVDQHS